MPDHDRIYTQQAADYHDLIAKQPDLTAIIKDIRPIRGLDIVDLGAGTGRLTTILAPEANPSLRWMPRKRCLNSMPTDSVRRA
jgi:2-polyprenyl-3-methyl-5-hydroxy-6-metoxy-1,4-benzoquinol methylase